MVGYFSLNAQVDGQTTTVSNPSALALGYLKPFADQFEFKIGYSLLLADYAASDMGYGLNAGINYFPFNSAMDEKYKSDNFEVFRYEDYKPFLSLGFVQRNFQSVKNSYAGFGAGVGVEKYYDKTISFKAEYRYHSLTGPSDSSATEINLLIGIIYKI